jgi:hypothetical protein
MREIEWLREHKRLILDYVKLKNQKKNLNIKMKQISKKLNELDEELIRR